MTIHTMKCVDCDKEFISALKRNNYICHECLLVQLECGKMETLMRLDRARLSIEVAIKANAALLIPPFFL